MVVIVHQIQVHASELMCVGGEGTWDLGESLRICGKVVLKRSDTIEGGGGREREYAHPFPSFPFQSINL